MGRVSLKMLALKATGIDVVNNGWYWFSSRVIFLAYNSAWWLSSTYLKWICESFPLSARYLLPLFSADFRAVLFAGLAGRKQIIWIKTGDDAEWVPHLSLRSFPLSLNVEISLGHERGLPTFVMTPVTLLSSPPASSTMEHQAANHAETPFVSVFVELKCESGSTNSWFRCWVQKKYEEWR